ncbi:MAG: hypothetical protein K8R88_06625 [Armatimonadetes bacterium]|nr:hypothetical protein [Armatimonadota bacterium]
MTPQRGLGPTEELSEFLELGYPYYINPAPVSSLRRFKATSSKDANGNLLTFTYAGDAAKTVLSYQISTAGKLASYRLVVTSPQGGTDQKFTFQSIATTKSFAPGTFSMAIPDKYVPLFLSESDPISTDYPFPDLDLGTRKLSTLISKNLTVITLDRRNTSSVPTADIMNRVSATLAPFSASVGRILVSLDGGAPGWLATKLNSNERLAAYGTPVFALVNQKRQILGLWMGIDSEIPGQMKQAISDILTPKSRVKPKNASVVRSRL